MANYICLFFIEIFWESSKHTKAIIDITVIKSIMNTYISKGLHSSSSLIALINISGATVIKAMMDLIASKPLKQA
jgi:hypothetical protein